MKHVTISTSRLIALCEEWLVNPLLLVKTASVFVAKQRVLHAKYTATQSVGGCRSGPHPQA
jgi:hypothetical protein